MITKGEHIFDYGDGQRAGSMRMDSNPFYPIGDQANDRAKVGCAGHTSRDRCDVHAGSNGPCEPGAGNASSSAPGNFNEAQSASRWYSPHLRSHNVKALCPGPVCP